MKENKRNLCFSTFDVILVLHTNEISLLFIGGLMSLHRDITTQIDSYIVSNKHNNSIAELINL